MKKFIKSDNAVVGIIVAVLLIGLIMAVIAVLQTVFIPHWMEQIEADHMDEVAEQFAQLKFAIDIQATLNVTDVPVATPITLGSNSLPFLESARSFGFLEILPSSTSFTIENSTYNYTLGIIKYTSSNAYYIDQSYIYEAGALIVNQDEGNAMTVKPTITLENDGGIYNLNFTLINITDIGDKVGSSGYGTFPIMVEFNSRDDTESINDISRFFINTSYYRSWSNQFNSIFRREGFTENDEYTITETSNGIRITFDPNVTVNVKVTIITVNAQIAPGWIEE